MGSLERVLIANRGEIAIRIAKAASGLGMESVAVAAPADAESLHTRLATEWRTARRRRAPTTRSAPTSTPRRWCEIAQETGCDCVHPGYGFLAENAAFAERCARRGPHLRRTLPGDAGPVRRQAAARELARSAGVAGRRGRRRTARFGRRRRGPAPRALGYPVLLKARAGGGGRGMRVVADDGAMDEAFERCRSEAAAAFGDGALFVEKLVERPRHIEVQILADADGQRRAPPRAGLLGAAAPPEGRRGRARPGPRRPASGPGCSPTPSTSPAPPATSTPAPSSSSSRPRPTSTSSSSATPASRSSTRSPSRSPASTWSRRSSASPPASRWPRSACATSRRSAGPAGFAVQARVVATGAGTIAAYKEPSGPGVRVDACGYAGYAPPPQFDPLLAKVIGASSSSGTLTSAVERTRRALRGVPHRRACPRTWRSCRRSSPTPTSAPATPAPPCSTTEPALSAAPSPPIATAADGSALALLARRAPGNGATATASHRQHGRRSATRPGGGRGRPDRALPDGRHRARGAGRGPGTRWPPATRCWW